ncbi:lipopolysaccharide biosynthesis protein [Tabrizicola sp. TH137]|uniref:GumC family protein n=1 Tax=Tabrizicola sp. TH137 TaxID=2067452 RepID=UPI000C79EA91|nr:Wzz/FepE/Etk N-terminal domain-containing protein [Tabrizicola sp. TH137]PLL10749.1 lipopolysaccharide biosynthesis protein [Tabrizicola sp. TH137]
MDLRFYLSRFLRQVHWFLLVVVVFAAAGFVAARVLPTVYVASALLVVESEQIPDALAQSTVQTQASEQLQIIEQRILARDKLLDVADRLRIYEVVRPGAERPLTAGEIVADMRSRVDINTTFDRGGSGRAQATLVRVSFDSPEAQLAAAVTNELVTLILEEDVAMRTVVARQTLEFFQQEVERLEQAMAERSGAILAFKEKNLSALPDSLEFRREELTRVQARVAELEREEAAISEQIDRLARLRSSTTAAATGEATAGTTGGVTTRDIRRDDLVTQLGFVTDEKARLEARVLELTTSISQTPGNAVLLEALEREYSNIRSQYDQAVSNRAKAETGETIEALSKGQRITVIEQAVAPDAPTKPNRPKIMAAGIGAGMMAGLGLVAVLEFLRGAVRRPADLTSALGITPLATLPYVPTLAEKRRNRMLAVGGVVILILTIVLGIWLVHTQVMPLDLIMENLRARLPLWMSL